MKDNTIALIGFMGVGKTSVGQVLARLIGMDFIDADAKIEQKAQMPISRIFELYGEGHFRNLEHEFYSKISSMQNTVLATGGGAVLDSRTRDILRKNAMVVHLTASPEIIFMRLDGDNNRPLLLENNKLEKITKLLSERDDFYRRTCHITINTDVIDIIECAKIISQLVFGLTKKPE